MGTAVSCRNFDCVIHKKNTCITFAVLTVAFAVFAGKLSSLFRLFCYNLQLRLVFDWGLQKRGDQCRPMGPWGSGRTLLYLLATIH